MDTATAARKEAERVRSEGCAQSGGRRASRPPRPGGRLRLDDGRLRELVAQGAGQPRAFDLARLLERHATRQPHPDIRVAVGCMRFLESRERVRLVFDPDETERAKQAEPPV